MEVMERRWRCHRCGEPIGAYEPMIVVEGDSERVSSALEEAQLAGAQGMRFHAECRAGAPDRAG